MEIVTNKMKVYLAARYSWKDKLKDCREELEAMGIEVTSRWLNERKGASSNLEDLTPRFCREHAEIDKEDIRNCDVLVLFTQPPTEPFVRGGRHHEAGYAEGLGKKIVLCGPIENIFHYNLDYIQCNDFTEVKHFLEYLGG